MIGFLLPEDFWGKEGIHGRLAGLVGLVLMPKAKRRGQATKLAFLVLQGSSGLYIYFFTGLSQFGCEEMPGLRVLTQDFLLPKSLSFLPVTGGARHIQNPGPKGTVHSERDVGHHLGFQISSSEGFVADLGETISHPQTDLKLLS